MRKRLMSVLAVAALAGGSLVAAAPAAQAHGLPAGERSRVCRASLGQTIYVMQYHVKITNRQPISGGVRVTSVWLVPFPRSVHVHYTNCYA